MTFRKHLEIKPEPTLSEAAEKTRSLIRGLEARLRAEAAVPLKPPSEENPEDLDRQLQQYFANPAARQPGGVTPEKDANILEQIRNRVIDGVVDRILREWERPGTGTSTPLENEAVEKLINRVLERLAKGAGG